MRIRTGNLRRKRGFRKTSENSLHVTHHQIRPEDPATDDFKEVVSLKEGAPLAAVADVSDEKQGTVDSAVDAQLSADQHAEPHNPDWIIGDSASAGAKAYGYGSEEMPDLLNGINTRLIDGDPSYSFTWDDDFADKSQKDSLRTFKSRVALRAVP